MKRSKLFKWLGLVALALIVGTAIAGTIVYAATSASQEGKEADVQEGAEVAAPAAQSIAELDTESGLVIVHVDPEGPGAQAGVVRGDILLKIDGEAVDSHMQLRRQLADLEIEAGVELEVLHGDDLRTLTATVQERNGRPYLGLTPCGNMLWAEADVVMPDLSGAIIVRVLPDTPAEAAGLKSGDRVVAVGGQELDEAHGLAELIAGYAPGDVVTLAIERPGEEAFEVEVALGEHPDQEGAAYLGVEYGPFPRMPHVDWGALPGDPFPFDAPPDMPHMEFDGVELQQGVILRQVDDDSPAAQAGLSEGDVITAIDGQPVEHPRDLVDAVTAREPGDSITLTVLADDGERDVTVPLGEHPEEADRAYLGVSVGGFLRFGGMEGGFPPLDGLPFDLPHLDRMPFWDGLEEGVLVQSVVEDGPAAEAGLEAGDVITAVDGEPVPTPQDLIDALAEREPGDVVALTVARLGDEQPREMSVTLAENPEQEGQAYLGVYVGHFTHSFRFEGGHHAPFMGPFQEYLDQFRERMPFDEERGPGLRFRWQPEQGMEWLPFDFDFDFDLELPPPIDDEPCCTADVSA